jgi:FHA domain
MIVCPNCQHKEVTGTIFCSHCGAQLLTAAVLETHKIHTSEARAKGFNKTGQYKSIPKDLPSSWISLHMVDSGQIVPLADREEFTLGRITEGQPIMPDVDLSPFNAYANGVSRLHAVLKREGEKATLTDLGSSNGTYINGNRIIPHTEQPINHGDLIYLGKLKFQVLFGKHD